MSIRVWSKQKIIFVMHCLDIYLKVLYNIDGGDKMSARIAYGTKLDKELKEGLQKLSEETRITQSKLLDEAIEDLLKKYEKKRE